jgi:uncharacterized protein YegJ (DUF2314 family)
MKYSYLFLFLLFLYACKGQDGYVSRHENNGDEVITVKSEDEAMNAAIAKAVNTFPEFLKAFNTPDSSNRDFTVKRKFAYTEDDGGVEHMWLTDLHFQGDKLIGVLDSEPIHISWIQPGDSLEIKIDSVSDWMYVRNDKLVGGYTLRALYEKMSEKDKKELASQLDFKIE